jgi:hypothetical protein
LWNSRPVPISEPQTHKNIVPDAGSARTRIALVYVTSVSSKPSVVDFAELQEKTTPQIRAAAGMDPDGGFIVRPSHVR